MVGRRKERIEGAHVLIRGLHVDMAQLGDGRRSADGLVKVEEMGLLSGARGNDFCGSCNVIGQCIHHNSDLTRLQSIRIAWDGKICFLKFVFYIT